MALDKKVYFTSCVFPR